MVKEAESTRNTTSKISALKNAAIYSLEKLDDKDKAQKYLKQALEYARNGAEYEGSSFVMRYHVPASSNRAKVASWIPALEEGLESLRKTGEIKYKTWRHIEGSFSPHLVERSHKFSGLIRKLSSTIAIISLFGAMFFLSSNITGNVIGSLNPTSSNWIGGVYFC